MRRLLFIALLATAAVWMSACGAPATNVPANTNTNTNANVAKATAAAPTVDTLFAMDKQANEAYTKGDSKFFEGFLSDKFVMYEGGRRVTKADSVAMISKVKCDMKSWSLGEPQMARIDDDTYVISYKGIFDGTCNDGPGGTAVKLPSPVRGASVYARNGDKWVPVFHGETAIVDPKNPPPAPATSGKKEEPKASDAKKDQTSNTNSNSNANTSTANSSAAPTAAGPNTDALTKLHAAGWEAFRTKDAKKFQEITTKDLSFVDAMGGWTSGQANVIKLWTETMKCEGITKTSFTEGFATALSPTVEILTGKGTADGTCEGQKNGDLYNTAFYVKEGDAWKLAFLFEPGM